MLEHRDITMNELKILSALLQGDKYGLEIVDAVKETNTNLFLGSLYNILSRLENKGFVESYDGEATSERGGNKRKYFRITGKGENAVNEAQSAFSQLWNWKLAYSEIQI